MTANAFRPGGRLVPGEGEIEGLQRKLTSKLAPTISNYQPKWEVGELVCMWWRPNFETAQVQPTICCHSHTQYPYIPAHITKPKECKRLFIVPLSERCMYR